MKSSRVSARASVAFAPAPASEPMAPTAPHRLKRIPPQAPAGPWARAVDVIYVENDGHEYPAKIVPLPTNKGAIVRLPAFKSTTQELERINQLPLAQQFGEMQEFQRKLSAGVPHLQIKKRLEPLIEYRGHLVLAIAINSMLVPAPELLVDFARQDSPHPIPDLKFKRYVRPVEYVMIAPRGQPQVPYFKPWEGD